MLRRELLKGSYASQGVMHFVQDDSSLMLTPIGSVLELLLVNFHELCSLTSSSFSSLTSMSYAR